MKLTLNPVMWSRNGAAITYDNPIMHEVQGWPGTEPVKIYGTTTGEGTTWGILRNGR